MYSVVLRDIVKLHVIASLILAAVLIGLLAPSTAPPAHAMDGSGPFPSLDAALKAGFIHPESVETAVKDGSAPVIVRLRLTTPFKPEGTLDSKSLAAQRQAIQSMQSVVLTKLTGLRTANVKRFESIPHLALQADTATLTALVGLNEVENVAVDYQSAPTLVNSVPLIGADKVRRAEGVAGSGQAVAILDTGVDSTHPFLTPRVVGEACFSSSSSWFSLDPDDASFCPGGADAVIAPGSGSPCSIADCEHGTHVAGIAAGRGATFNGVAPEANIVAIKVFHSHDDVDDCHHIHSMSPCLLASESDIIQGLERVSAWRSSMSIAAVNLSLGYGSYTSQSDCDSDNSSYKDAIDNLRSFRVATIATSGNEGINDHGVFTPGVAAPACLSSAVSVGSTSGVTTPVETISSFSQAAGFLNLLAPGEGIRSSVPAVHSCLAVAGFCSLDGTSMAAPHVAGAWAVLQALSPGESVTTILNVLTSTGKPISDTRGATPLVKPRIRVDAAAEALLGRPLPPTGLHMLSVSGTSIDLAWDNNARTATSLSVVFKRSRDTAWVVGATDPANYTAATIGTLVPNTSYDFQVRACGLTACSDPSNSITVSTLDTLPSAPDSLRTGVITNNSIEFLWNSTSIHPITYFQLSSNFATYTFDSSSSAFWSHRYTVGGLGPNQFFVAQIRACNADGCSDYSNAVLTTTLTLVPVPAAPSDLHACQAIMFRSVCTAGGPTLDWTNNSTDATSIDFEWNQAQTDDPMFAGTWNHVTLVGAATSYQVPRVTSGSLYHFQVRACNAGGCSQLSNLVLYTP